MKYDIIVWDFNGTLLDDMQAGINSVNNMLSRRGLKTIDGIDGYRSVFCFPIIEYYRRLGFDFEAEDYYTVLAPEWVKLYNEYSKESKLTDGAERILNDLHQMKISQILLSATEINMLKRQVRELGIADWFDEIRGLGNIHAHSKVNLALDMKNKHPNKRMLVIGDTVHDFEVASAIDADCLLFAGGHMSREILKKCDVPVVEKLDDIKSFIV